MSNIEKLLKGVEVEWKTLGEVCEINTGQKPPIILDKPTNFDYINAGTSKSGYCKNSNCEGDTVTTPSRGQGGIGYVGYQSHPFWLGPLCYKLKSTDQSILINKFLFYFLQSECQLILGLKKEGGVPAINKYDLANILIPIPPLEIQKEIVRILDKFSMLTAELQAELQARKSQYEYYRNQLLTYPMEESDQPSLRSSRSATSIQNSDTPMQPLSTSNPHTGNSVLQPRGKVEWETLGEIFNLKNGYTPSKSNQEYWENGTIPWFRMEDIRENGRVLNKSIQYVNSCAVKGGKLFPANSIIVATSATIGEHALITVPFLSNQRFTNLSLKKEYADKFLIRFLFYYSFVLDEWCKNNITIGNFAGVDMIGFKKFLIPIPPLEEQKRIVSILDKFDILTTSITEGLPKEIELRQKQYEYYRDMLLSFPKNNIKV